MSFRPLVIVAGILLLAAAGWAGSSLWTRGAADPGGIPQLDRRARALPPETACTPPAPGAAGAAIPRCVIAFGRAVGAIGVASEGSPAVISLVHAATGSWTLPGATYAVPFDPLPAEREAQAILASAGRDTALLAVGPELIGYQLSTGHVIAKAAGPGGMIDDLAWTDDGAWLVAIAGGKATVLDANGKPMRTLATDGSALHLAVSADGAHTAVASDVGAITLFDADEAAPRTVTPSLQPAEGLAFAGGALWVAGSDGTLRSLDPSSGAERLRIDAGTPLTRLAAAPDGQRLAVAGRDRALRIYALPGGELQATLAWHPAQITALAWGAGPTLLSGDADGALAVWDVATAAAAR